MRREHRDLQLPTSSYVPYCAPRSTGPCLPHQISYSFIPCPSYRSSPCLECIFHFTHNSSACGLNVKLPFSQRCMYDLTCHHFSLFHLSVLHPSGFCLRNEGVVITGNVDSRGDGITKCELRLCWAVERPRPLIKLPPTECFKNLADGSQLTDAAVTLGRNEVCKTNLKHLDLHRDYCTPPSLFISLR